MRDQAVAYFSYCAVLNGMQWGECIFSFLVVLIMLQAVTCGRNLAYYTNIMLCAFACLYYAKLAMLA